MSQPSYMKHLQGLGGTLNFLNRVQQGLWIIKKIQCYAISPLEAKAMAPWHQISDPSWARYPKGQGRLQHLSSPLVLRQRMSMGCEGGGDCDAVITPELDPETQDSLAP